MRTYAAPIALALLLLGTQPAGARGYGFSFSYGHHGGHYGGHHGGHHGGHFGYSYRGYGPGYGYSPYYYRGYNYSPYYRGYAYAPPYYRGYSSGGSYEEPIAVAPDAPSGTSGQSGDGRVYRSEPQRSAESGQGGAATGSMNVMDGAGWSLLAEGSYPGALASFAAQAQSAPTRGVPKVGYALSAAAAGDPGRGVWAMRRAFLSDPDSIEYVVMDERLRLQVEQLVQRYQERLDGTGPGAGSEFMMASLHYLLGDTEAARGSIEQALHSGDRSESTRNLQRLIDRRLGQGGASPAPDSRPEPGAGAPEPSSY